MCPERATLTLDVTAAGSTEHVGRQVALNPTSLLEGSVLNCPQAVDNFCRLDVTCC